MFIAGSKSSSTTVEWAMAELMKNPKVMEKAQAEVRRIYNEKGYVDESEIDQLKYLNPIVRETTLRLHPPGVLLLPRENTERCVINGYEIPEKTKIIVNGWAIGRDSKSWDEVRPSSQRDFWIIQLISEEPTLSIYHLVLEGECVLELTLLYQTSSFHLPICSIILVGSPQMDSLMRNLTCLSRLVLA
ncbi:hypothetical protein K1719_012703 [Acacia pycnantha]|nr:hypothetical protein K1719_012703 [Acacia pycnantha]